MAGLGLDLKRLELGYEAFDRIIEADAPCLDQQDAAEAGQNASIETGRASRAVADEAAESREPEARAAADAVGRTAEAARKAMRASIETAAKSVERLTGQFVQVLGFHSPRSVELARRLSRNLEAVSQASAVLAQGAQEISREWVGLVQERIRGNLDLLDRLTRSRTIHDVIVIQSDLARDTLQRVIDTNRRAAEVSVRISDEAARIITADGGDVRRAA